MSEPCQTPEFVTVEEAAAILKVTERTVRKMLDDGRLVRVKLTPGPRGVVRIPMDSIRALVVPSDPPADTTEGTEGDR